MSKIFLLGLPLRRGDIHVYGTKPKKRMYVGWEMYHRNGAQEVLWDTTLSQYTSEYNQSLSMQQYFLTDLDHYVVWINPKGSSLTFVSSSNIGRIEQELYPNSTYYHLYDIDFYKDAFLEVDVI